jgi:hypothetical protein
LANALVAALLRMLFAFAGVDACSSASCLPTNPGETRLYAAAAAAVAHRSLTALVLAPTTLRSAKTPPHPSKAACCQTPRPALLSSLSPITTHPQHSLAAHLAAPAHLLEPLSASTQSL